MNSVLLKTLAAICLAGGLLSQVAPTGAQDMPPVPKALLDAGVLRVGVKCDSPPFGYTTTDGKNVGIEIEIAKQIATAAFGSPDKLELICTATDARIPSLETNKVDLLVATLGKTKARDEVIDFSDPYFWGTSSVLVPKDSLAHTIADLDGGTLIAVKGGSAAKWFSEHYPAIELIQLNSVSDNVQALIQGRADGYAADGGVVASLAAQYQELRILEEGFDPGANAVGVRQGDAELQAFVNGVLEKLKAEKFYAAVAPDHISEPALLTQMLTGFETDPPEAALTK